MIVFLYTTTPELNQWLEEHHDPKWKYKPLKYLRSAVRNRRR